MINAPLKQGLGGHAAQPAVIKVEPAKVDVVVDTAPDVVTEVKSKAKSKKVEA